jgi:geranylgeranyl pyrophosphate synthase
VADDLNRTKDYAINNILQTDYKDLESASRYNLLLKGKNFRSAILFLLARTILQDDFAKYHDRVMCLAACIEIAHNASLLQDDIIDKSDSRRSQLAAHKVYGVSTSVFASDWMISRASRMLTEVFSENTDVSQIFSTVLFNLVFGELIQAKRDMENVPAAGFNAERYFQSYIAKTYYKTASMISLGCRGLAVVLDLDEEK